MISEAAILKALEEKPMRIQAILARTAPGGSEETLRSILLKMRDAGKVLFNINSGMWTKA